MKITLLPPAGARALVSDLTDMTRNPRPVTADDRDGISLELPDDAYFEYAWQKPGGQLEADPAAPETTRNVWYGDVSVIRGPGQRDDPVALEAASAGVEGKLTRHRLDSGMLGQARRLATYEPAGTDEDAELPLIIVQDGPAFQRIGLLPSVLEALVRDGLPPARLVFVEPVDRDSEYSFSDSYHRFILEELLPQLPELAGPHAELHLLGASLGGLASATLALRQPGLFSGVATLSGAFLGAPGDRDPYRADSEWVLGQVRDGARLPDRWFTGTGTLEWLYGPNRRLAEALDGRGVRGGYLELAAGHNWPNWRNMLAPALRALLS